MSRRLSLPVFLVTALVTFALAACTGSSSGGDPWGLPETSGWGGRDVPTSRPDGGGAPDSGSGERDALTIGDGGAGDGGGALPDGHVPGPDLDQTHYGLVFSEPAQASTVRGSIRIALRPADAEEWAGVLVDLRIDEIPIFHDTKLPTDLVLDTTQYDNGLHELRATAEIAGTVQTGELVLTFDNPAYTFRQVTHNHPPTAAQPVGPPFYRDGETLRIDVDLGVAQTDVTLTADFSALDSNAAGPSAAGTVSHGDGTYTITHTISATNSAADGDHAVPLRASDPSGLDLAYDNLVIALRNDAPTPLILLGGMFVDEPPPATTPDGIYAPRVESLTGSAYIITGGTARLIIQVGDPQGMGDIIGLIVATNGYSGFYQMPLPAAQQQFDFALTLDPTAAITDGQSLTARVAVLDRTGKVSAYATKQLTTIPVQSGDVQVSVSWNNNADVDLHVIEPAPSCDELYYGDSNGVAGGELDLDSNAGCGGRDVRNENVSWPVGQSPPGTYTVLLDHWSACGNSSTDYTVTVKVCGEIFTYEGRFTSSDASGGGRCSTNLGGAAGELCYSDGGSAFASSGCRLITNFDNLCGAKIEGYLRYEDRTFTRDGFRALTWKPVRHALVEARRATDDAVLGSTTTDRFGYYRVGFVNSGDPGIYIAVISRTDPEDELRNVAVFNHPKFGRLYEVRSDSVDDAAHQAACHANPSQICPPQRIDMDIPVVDDSGVPRAGAFNIFDVAVQGYDRIRRMTGKVLGGLSLHWQTGADTTATLYCTEEMFLQQLCEPADSIQIQGKDEDRDEYDDCVILRQLYKFAEKKISASDNPGGLHDGTRGLPPAAWSEGMATFFACHARGDSVFVDTNWGGVYRVRDLETEDSPFSRGTSNGSQGGYYSEYLVSAVLWDLVDGAGEDPVMGRPNAVYDSVFNWMPSEACDGSRGHEGLDLVDFLDGWFCRGYEARAELRSLLNDRRFPYDFGGPARCQ